MSQMGPEAKKKQAFKELLNTEQTLQQNMALFQKGNKMDQLIQNGLKDENITLEERRVLLTFEILAKQAAGLVGLSETLLQALNKKDPFSDETSEAMSNVIKACRTYPEIFDVAVKELSRVKEQGGKFVLEKVDNEARDAENKLQGLGGLLIQPIQRIMRYPLLLGQIAKHADIAEREKIDKIKIEAEKVLEDVNNTKSLPFIHNELLKVPGVEVSIKHKRAELLLILPEGWTFEKVGKEKSFLRRTMDFFSSREKFVVKDEEENIVFNMDFQSGIVKIREEESDRAFHRDEYLNRLNVLHALTTQIATTKSGKTPYVQLKPKKRDVGTVSYLNELAAKDSTVFYKLSRKDEKARQAALKRGIVKPKDIQEHGISTSEVKNADGMEDVIKRKNVPHSDKRINFENKSIIIKETVHLLIAA